MKYILTENCVKDITSSYLEDKGKFFDFLEIKSCSLEIHGTDIYLSVYFYADDEPDMEIIPLDMNRLFFHH